MKKQTRVRGNADAPRDPPTAKKFLPIFDESFTTENTNTVSNAYCRGWNYIIENLACGDAAAKPCVQTFELMAAMRPGMYIHSMPGLPDVDTDSPLRGGYSLTVHEEEDIKLLATPIQKRVLLLHAFSEYYGLFTTIDR